MKWIKELYSNHPLLGVGFGLYFFVQIALYVLPKFFGNVDDWPKYLMTSIVVLFITSLLLSAIGGVLYLSKGPNTTTFNSRVKHFFKGYWHSAKLAIFLTLMFLIGIALYALYLNLSFS